MNPFELMPLKGHRHSPLQELNAPIKVVYVQQLVYDLLKPSLFFGSSPIGIKGKGFQNPEGREPQETEKAVIGRFAASEVLRGEKHFEEIDSEDAHEEEDADDGRSDASDVREHIEIFEISLFDGGRGWRSIQFDVRDTRDKIRRIFEQLYVIG